MRYQGRLHDWNDDKGFGFVTPVGQTERIFVHVKAFAARPRRPVNGDLLNFELEQDERGRPRAVDVRFAGAPVRGGTTTRTHGATQPGPRWFAVAFCGGVLVAALTGRVPPVVPWVYLVASCATFIAYAYDKSAAMGGRWRTAESTLLLLGLGGGWPGAVFAQHLFRHKSSKASFQTAFRLSIALNCAACIALLTTTGQRLLAGVLHAP